MMQKAKQIEEKRKKNKQLISNNKFLQNPIPTAQINKFKEDYFKNIKSKTKTVNNITEVDQNND